MPRRLFNAAVVALCVLLVLPVAGCNATATRTTGFAVIDGERAPIPEIPMGNPATVERIITIAQNDCRVMDHLTYLCETFGARLTGSTACDDANRWARDVFEAWGLHNPRLEKWGDLDARFDRLESSVEIVSLPRVRGRGQDEPEWQVDRVMEFSTLSWTLGTDGPITARVVAMPESIDAIGSDPDLYAGAFVLLPALYGDRRGVRAIGFSMRQREDRRHSIRTGEYDPFAEPEPETWAGTVSHEGDEFEFVFLPDRNGTGEITGGHVEVVGYHAGPIAHVSHEDSTIRFVWANPVGKSEISLTVDDNRMTGLGDDQHPIELERTIEPDRHALTREEDQILARLLEAGPAGFLSASLDERVWTTRSGFWDVVDPDALPGDPELTIRRSDYDYINSRLADGQEIHARVNLDHRIDAGPIPVYNTIAEIRGSTRPEEIVIVSAHLDSWDGPGSQGTVDNGTGSAVVMEAARLLIEAGARPHRTIKFILWTGEEQGLLGSREYVRRLSEEERARISAVFVDDGGTNYQGGLPAADFMVEYLAAATAPINGRFYSDTDGEYMNVNIRPTGETIRTHGGSDHASFNRVGIPGFFWDEIGRAEYGVGWHTQKDRLDLAIEEYLVQSSACMAVTAYNLACAPGLLPRQAPETLLADEVESVTEQAALGR